MTWERIVGLEVIDQELYKQYRLAMMPILENYGGGFRYDFLIQDTLKVEYEKL